MQLSLLSKSQGCEKDRRVLTNSLAFGSVTLKDADSALFGLCSGEYHHVSAFMLSTADDICHGILALSASRGMALGKYNGDTHIQGSAPPREIPWQVRSGDALCHQLS